MSVNGNGNGVSRRGLLGTATVLLSALPPTFIALLLINCIFIGFVLWFLDAIAESRLVVMTKILDACLKHVQ